MRCSDAARERRDLSIGTAAPARRWLLIEHPGPWQPNALAGSGISAAVQRELNRTAHVAEARILLIRRPGRQAPGMSRAWAVLSYDGAAVWGTWASDEDLLSAAEVLTKPSTGAAAGQEPVLLVCAHGLHDVCCAVRGRPVAAALQQVWPESTWECSHVGGDRFAANLVVLPDGVYYGNLDAESAVAAVHAHRAGRLDVPVVRGFSVHRPPAQAAVAGVHERFGPFGARDVVVTQAMPRRDGHWEIDLIIRAESTPPGTPTKLRATVVTEYGPSGRLTCRALNDTHSLNHRIVEITALDNRP